MISWTIATTGLLTTSYFSSHNIQTTSFTRTINGSTSSVNPFFGSVTNSVTASESGSAIISVATIRSANQTATFQTLLQSVQTAYNFASGATDAFAGTTFTNSVQYQPPTSSEIYPKLTTTSGLRTMFTQRQDTSTVTTVSTSKFGTIQSSSASPVNAVAVSQSSGILVTTVVQNETTVPMTTEAPVTFWFFASVSTAKSATVTTTQTITTSGISRATVYQAEHNEALYSIFGPNSYEATPKAARPLAQTATRITVFPILETASQGDVTGFISLTAQFSGTINLSDATSSETVAEASEFTRTITQYGPDQESTTVEYFYTVSTTTTQSTPANYAYTQASDRPPLTFADESRSDTYNQYDEAQVSLQANRFLDPLWRANLLVRLDAGTAQQRYGKSMFVIAGQKGLEAGPTDFPIDLSPFSGSYARGQITFFDVTNDSFTFEVPSLTYKTTQGTVATTSSVIITAQGQPQLIGDGVASPDHLGGGAFAESWTVVDRVQPEYVYSDLKNSESISHLGNDTSYGQGESNAVSYLTFEPYLLGGGLLNGNAPAPDAIVWTEFRNPPAYPA